ncbi:MAG TPA: hypothetical protein VGX22_13185 [Candidatus Dormibacteraeota bacterium]|nr:hypothetical protein [Candidatus Dormibacteraeota bacterium]
MSTSLLWAIGFVVDGLLGLVLAVLVLDGAQQVTTGRPGFLPFERLLYKRVPASEMDCIRRGAAELLQALAVTFISGPQIVLAMIATGNLTGAMSPPASAYPKLVPVLLFMGYGAIVAFGLFCAITAYNISTKIKYVPTGTGARSTSI